MRLDLIGIKNFGQIRNLYEWLPRLNLRGFARLLFRSLLTPSLFKFFAYLCGDGALPHPTKPSITKALAYVFPS